MKMLGSREQLGKNVREQGAYGRQKTKEFRETGAKGPFYNEPVAPPNECRSAFTSISQVTGAVSQSRIRIVEVKNETTEFSPTL